MTDLGNLAPRSPAARRLHNIALVRDWTIITAAMAILGSLSGCMDAGMLGQTYQTDGTGAPAGGTGSCAGCPVLIEKWSGGGFNGILKFQTPRGFFERAIDVDASTDWVVLQEPITIEHPEHNPVHLWLDVVQFVDTDPSNPYEQTFTDCTVDIGVPDNFENRRVSCQGTPLDLGLQITDGG